MFSFKINKKYYLKAILLVALVITMCTLTMVLTGYPDTTMKSLVYVIMSIIGGACLFGLIYLLMGIFSKKPRLVISAGGLHDHYTGSINWHNINSVIGYQRGRSKYLSLGITDVRPLIEQRDITQRMAFTRKLERDKDHVSIFLNPLDGDPDEIFEAVKQKWKEATGRNDQQ